MSAAPNPSYICRHCRSHNLIALQGEGRYQCTDCQFVTDFLIREKFQIAVDQLTAAKLPLEGIERGIFQLSRDERRALQRDFTLAKERYLKLNADLLLSEYPRLDMK